MKRTGWPWFCAWALAGVGVGLLVSALGVLLLPFTVGAIVLLALKTTGVEALGLLEGIAAVCFFVAIVNADYWTCPSSGQIVHRSGGSVSIDSCGGLNPLPWLIVGLLLAVAAPLMYHPLHRSELPSPLVAQHTNDEGR